MLLLLSLTVFVVDQGNVKISVGRPLISATVVVTDCVCGGPGQEEGQVHQTGFPGLQQSGAGDSV